MKKIKTTDGQIINGYELCDLDEKTRTAVIEEHCQFLYENDEDENPEIRGEDEVIENIEINGYLFDECGGLIPICYHTKGNKVEYITYGKRGTRCELDKC
jgi:hypothetical protein